MEHGDDKPCATTRDECSVKSGTSGNEFRPTLTVDGLEYRCQPPTNIQPCDWKTLACQSDAADCLLGEAVYVAPILPIDTPFPNQCASGYLGSSSATYQTSPDCAGKCAAGTHCPTAVTLTEIPCPKGSYCDAGSTMPLPCPAGTYRSTIGAAGSTDCPACPEGHSCAAGSFAPTPCAPGTYAAGTGNTECTSCTTGNYASDSGAASCSLCPSGSYAPIIIHMHACMFIHVHTCSAGTRPSSYMSMHVRQVLT